MDCCFSSSIFSLPTTLQQNTYLDPLTSALLFQASQQQTYSKISSSIPLFSDISSYVTLPSCLISQQKPFYNNNFTSQENTFLSCLNLIQNLSNLNSPQLFNNSNDNRTLNSSNGNNHNPNNNNCEPLSNQLNFLNALLLDTLQKNSSSYIPTQKQFDNTLLRSLDIKTKSLQQQITELNDSILYLNKQQSELVTLPSESSNFRVGCPSTTMSQFTTLPQESQLECLTKSKESSKQLNQHDQLAELISKKNPFKVIRIKEENGESEVKLVKKSNNVSTQDLTMNIKFESMASTTPSIKEEEDIDVKRDEDDFEDIEDNFVKDEEIQSTASLIEKNPSNSKKQEKRFEKLSSHVIEIVDKMQENCLKISTLSIELCKKLAISNEVLKNRSYEAIASAIVIHASRIVGHPITIKKMSKLTTCKEKIINRVHLYLKKSISGFNPKVESSEHHIRQIINRMNMSDNILQVSLFFNDRSNTLNIVKNQHPALVAISIIILACNLLNTNLQVEEICDKSNVCYSQVKLLYKNAIYHNRFELIADYKILSIDFKAMLNSSQINLI